MKVQKHTTKTLGSPSEQADDTPYRKKVALVTETTDYTLPKGSSTRALKRRIMMPEEFENPAEQRPLKPHCSTGNLRSTKTLLNTALLVPVPIRVLCDLKQNQNIQEQQQQQRHKRLMTLEKEMDLEREGICFSKQPNVVEKLLRYSDLAKVVSYDLQPQGLCNSVNCSVRRQWVKMMRDELEQNQFRPSQRISTSSSSARSSEEPSSLAQIRHDAVRTFTNDLSSQPTAMEQKHLTYLQKTLEELLLAYSKSDSEVDYVQGMNLVAGAILNHLREINLSFRMFEFLMNKHNLRDIYHRQFSQLKQHCQQLFHRHLKGVAPDIYNHLSQQNVPSMSNSGPTHNVSSTVVTIDVLLHHSHQLYGTTPVMQHLVIELYVESGFAFLYRLALCYLIFLRDRILGEKEEAIVVLGTSYSRRLHICWPELIAASQRVPLC